MYSNCNTRYVTREISAVDQDGNPLDFVQMNNCGMIGFGADKSSWNTPYVIQFAERNFGTIRSFSGSYQAESWNVTIEGWLAFGTAIIVVVGHFIMSSTSFS